MKNSRTKIDGAGGSLPKTQTGLINMIRGDGDGKFTRPTRTISVETILDDIRTGKYEQELNDVRDILDEQGEDAYKAAKLFLPSFTTAATFPYRALKDLQDLSGYMILDIDLKSETMPEREQIKSDINADPHTFASFWSPSFGIKVFVKTDGIEPDPELSRVKPPKEKYSPMLADLRSKQAELFISIEKYYLKKLNIKIDKSGKDIARICFVCFDPDLFHNPESVPFILPEPEPEPISDPLGILSIPGFNQGTDETFRHPKAKDESFYAEIAERVATGIIERSLDGEKYPELLKASNLLGGYVAGGIMSEAEAISVLERAITSKPNVSCMKTAMKGITDGVKNGQSRPITLADCERKRQEFIATLPPREKAEPEIEIPDDFEEDIIGAATDDPAAVYDLKYHKTLEILKNTDNRRYQSLVCKLKGCKVSVGRMEDSFQEKAKIQNPAQSLAAGILTEKIRNSFGYDFRRENWYGYKNGIWRECTKNNVDVQAVFMGLMEDDKDNFPDGFSDSYLKGTTVLTGRKSPFFPAQTNKKGFIPFENGVLRTSDMVLTKHKPENCFSWCLPFHYKPDAECEKIRAWLKSAVKTEKKEETAERVEVIRAYLKAILTGRTDLHRFLELVGPAGSGKGTLIRLAEAMVGSVNVHNTSLKRLEMSQFEPAKLYQKKLAVFNETEQFVSELSVFKQLTGGDTLPYEEKHKQDSMPGFKPECMVILSSNTVLRSSDVSSGLNRRRITMFFKNPVRQENQRDLEKEFKPFLPGLINWILEMPETDVFKYLKSDTENLLADDKTETLMASNHIVMWITDNLIYDETKGVEIQIGEAVELTTTSGKDKVSFKDEDKKLYPNYRKFCADNGFNKDFETKQTFSAKVQDTCRNILSLSKVKKKRSKTGNGNSLTNLRINTDR